MNATRQGFDELLSELSTFIGVYPGYPLSLFLFTFVIDVILETILSYYEASWINLLTRDSVVDLKYSSVS